MGSMLKEKTAIVTGGAGGIGRFLCEALAGEGARVVIADIIDPGPALRMVEGVGGAAVAVECDLTDPASIQAMVAKTEETFGVCDVLVHCAAYQPHTPFGEVTLESWRRTLTVNVDSVLHLGQAVLPGMKSRGWGRVINFTTTTFYDATPHHSEYVMSKAALIGLTRILAKEYGPFGITANCLAPGLVRTSNSAEAVKTLMEAGLPDFYEVIRGQQCLSRTLVPEDMVGPVLFLASDASRAVTGQCLLADGGWQHV